MTWLVIVLCLPATLLVVAFIVMVIRDRLHPNYPSREDVAQKLRRVLDGTMSYYEWDDFTHIPLKKDSIQEDIRQACDEMEGHKDLFHRDDPKMQEKWIYNEKGLEKVKDLLRKIENSIEQLPAPRTRSPERQGEP